VAREGDKPLVAPESTTLIYKARKGQSQDQTFRFVAWDQCRQNCALVSTLLRVEPQAGLTEAIVSKRISERFQGMEIGDKFRVQTTDFEVTERRQAESIQSEVWVDYNALANATKRPDSSSVLLRATSPVALDALAKRISDDQRL
jgi:hypothetical protein